MKSITTFLPWYGSNRMNAHRPAELLKDCDYVLVGFAGGMCEVPHFKARTIVVNDLNWHLINTAKAMADEKAGPSLLRKLKRKVFHPAELAHSQLVLENLHNHYSDEQLAEAYYVACWMTRSGSAGTGKELTGNLCLRYDAGGGDSATRYHNSVESLKLFRQTLRRCSFSCEDIFTLIPKAVKNKKGVGCYLDAPFLKAGRDYTHNAGKTDSDEIAWHNRLRDLVADYTEARIVLRYYDHPLIRELYPRDKWDWCEFSGRDQANNDKKPEVLIVNRAA